MILDLTRRLISTRLFRRDLEASNSSDVIRWWEMRRIPFNLIVGCTGLFTAALLLLMVGIMERHLGDPDEPPASFFVAVFVAFVYGIAANLCFTLGWVAELLAKRLWPGRLPVFGEVAFFMGTVFSVLLTLVPAVVFCVMLLIRLLLR